MRSAKGVWTRTAAVAAALSGVASGVAAEPVIVTVEETFETASPGVDLPGQMTAPAWSDARISGLTSWTGTELPSRRAFATGAPVAENTGVKAELTTIAPSSIHSFIYGMRGNLFTHTAPARRAAFAPVVGQSLRIEADIFVSDVLSLWTFETISVASQRVVDRIYLGGPCDNFGGLFSPDNLICETLDIPDGAPGATLVANTPISGCIECPPYMLLRWLANPPTNGTLAEPVALPTMSWFRLIIERSLDHMMRIWIDLKDGVGPRPIGESVQYWLWPVDSFGANGSFSVVNSPYYMDNVRITGAIELCDGDADGDGDVDFADLNIVVSQFNTTGPGLGGDFDGDREVTFADLNTLVARFGQACD